MEKELELQEEKTEEQENILEEENVENVENLKTEANANVDEKENEDIVDEATEDAEDNEQDEEAHYWKKDYEEMKDKYLRLYSEFDNFRRRTAKEKVELIESASERIISEMLTIVDDFERAEKALGNKESSEKSNEENNEEKEERSGFLLIKNKFTSVLEKNGLKKMECKKGDDFDVEKHEAITQVPVTEEELKGKVIDAVESGYYLNEKIIRFTKVVLGN